MPDLQMVEVLRRSETRPIMRFYLSNIPVQQDK
jgi:hypothetical protein